MWGRVVLQSLTEIAVTHYYMHTQAPAHTHAHTECCGILRTGVWGVAAVCVSGAGGNVAQEQRPCLGHKENQVKPGCGEQEGSGSEAHLASEAQT